MPAGTGLLNRDITLTVGGATLQGVVTRDFTITNTPIEVTDDQSNGYREILAKGGLKTLDLAIAGDVKNYELAATIFASTQMVNCVVNLGDGVTTESSLTFDAFVADYSFGGSANEKNEYSATLQSSGAITWTPGT